MSEHDDFDDPIQGDRFTVADYLGRLCLFSPVEYRDKEKNPVKTEYGEKDAVITDIVVLATEKGQEVEEFTGSMILQGNLIGVLKAKAKAGEGRVLGTLALGERKSGQKPPYILVPATDAEKNLYRAWRKANPLQVEDPFAV